MTGQAYDRAYFDALYTRDADPWDFRTSDYEKKKYAATIAMIGDRRYARSLEVGCSIGVLSAYLAPVCDAFLGVDISEIPLAAARATCSAFPNARFTCMATPGDWPEGQFDLIVLSEVLYFLPPDAVNIMAARVEKSLVRGGRVILANWLGSEETPQPGDLAADQFLSSVGLPLRRQDRKGLYRLDLLEKDQAR
ncbi:class I SAM-dependent DNA methyltransferase [Acidisoma silvae]|uniref:Class I SAM-dependent methyltransferase n=1 Tax=Acidisoma silvae TaxID=2802396 RepID=A0A963YWB4_9PROT|nr:SAM-dependent methyltransferase [Acidisoma silvae]MCB8878329.1 class I SAM-dependent methyltransferase [Acidisoma silvae]